MPKTFDEAGELILGTRFKKLGDKFLDDVSLIYKELGINFETPWFAIFFTLDKYGKLTMSEIASNLGVTQSAISQTVSILEKRGLIKIESQETDKRTKVVSFTENGIALLTRVKPVWKSIKNEMKNMLKEGKKSRHMLSALSELEMAFVKKSLTERVLKDIKDTNLRIEKYKKQHFKEMKRLIFSWIFEYGAPFCDFINNINTVLDNNDVFISFSDEHITAASIILKNRDKKEMFIINKNDFEDGSYIFLLKNVLDEQNGKIDIIYLDKRKKSARRILKNREYIYKKTIKFSEGSKELLLFEAEHG